MIREIRKRIDICIEWRRLTKKGTYNPGPSIDGFFNKLDRLETITGCCFIIPIMRKVSLERRMIQNQMKKDLRVIRKEKDSELKFDLLFTLLTRKEVSKNTVKNPKKLSRLLESTIYLFRKQRKEVPLFLADTKIRILEEKIKELSPICRDI